MSTIAIDVDGTLADYSQGWQGKDVIGAPLPGARAFLQRLHDNGYRVCIFTCRDTDRVTDWLNEHSLYFDEVNTNSEGLDTPGKIMADVYLDDKGLRFDGDYEQAYADIAAFSPWYKAQDRETLTPTERGARACGKLMRLSGIVPRL